MTSVSSLSGQSALALLSAAKTPAVAPAAQQKAAQAPQQTAGGYIMEPPNNDHNFLSLSFSASAAGAKIDSIIGANADQLPRDVFAQAAQRYVEHNNMTSKEVSDAVLNGSGIANFNTPEKMDTLNDTLASFAWTASIDTGRADHLSAFVTYLETGKSGNLLRPEEKAGADAATAEERATWATEYTRDIADLRVSVQRSKDIKASFEQAIANHSVTIVKSTDISELDYKETRTFGLNAAGKWGGTGSVSENQAYYDNLRKNGTNFIESNFGGVQVIMTW